MRRLITVLALAAVSILGVATAEAATTSVAGTNAYEKLVVNNGTNNLVANNH